MTLDIFSSDAKRQFTDTNSGFMSACSSSGLGAKRVHKTTPSGSGSPDATPSLNGSSVKRGRNPRVSPNDNPPIAIIACLRFISVLMRNDVKRALLQRDYECNGQSLIIYS